MVALDAYATNSPNTLKGKRLYHSYCLVCHGEEGKTIGPLAKKLDYRPADLSSEIYQRKTVEELAAVIAGYGRKVDSKMPSWGTAFPQAELRDIAAYIADFSRGETRRVTNFKGDTRRGRTIFKGACLACHGQFGTGNGVLAYLIGIPMIDFSDNGLLEEISDEELVEIIRGGKGNYMASWKGTLDESEIIDVAAYVRTLPALAGETFATYEPSPLEGRRLYRSYCLVCHGVDGKSIGPVANKLDLKPADLSSRQYQEKKVEGLAALIAGYGRRDDSNMPSWGAVLSREELSDIAAYLFKLSRDDLEFRGDPRRGRAIFKATCTACHGEYGAGNGILAQLIGIAMVDFTKPKKMAQISDEELIHSIREGKGAFMAAWKQTFSENEIIDVASYVRTLANQLTHQR
jgi:mono/diheme cytochrome c family protein